MSMTREEARIELQAMKDTFEEYEPGGSRCQIALNVALSALRPVSREQVEKVWNGCINCHDKEKLAKHIHCWPSFCPVCGRPLTAEAVEMVMERMEELHDTSN